MPSLIWTPAALADVRRLYGFLARRNSDAARRAAAAIRAGVAVLPEHPNIGRSVEQLGPGYREWRVRFGRDGYVVLYRLDGEVIAILAVRHSREAGY